MVKTWRMEKSLRMLKREERVDGLKKFLETRRQIVFIDIQKLSSAEAKHMLPRRLQSQALARGASSLEQAGRKSKHGLGVA